MSKYKTVESLFYVDIERPSKEEINSYYTDNDEFQSTSNTASTPRVMQKATILHTCNETTHPIGSVWMMGESPGTLINYFGEKLTMIQLKDIYARIN